MSDDQGPWAMGCAGTPELETPTLDLIASEGMRFDSFFCASPVCSPARATFLTGRMPSSHGVHDWLKSGNIEVEDGVTWCGRDRPIEYLEGLRGFTDILTLNGYRCGLSGKWHLGASGTPQKGHDYWCAHTLGGDRYTGYYIYDNEPEMTQQSQYVTDMFTDRALTFLDEHGRGDDPFCLSVHYTAPHAPWYREEQPEEIWSMYEKRAFPSMPILPPHQWGGWNPTPEKRRETIEGYFTTITAMDRNIARIIEKLESLGIAKNTVVIFTSDNGYSMGHHGIHGKGNGTFPVNMFEEAVKVPFLLRYPGTVSAGTTSDALLSHYDVLPTIIELAGIDEEGLDALPGRSFARVLRGESGGHEAVLVCDEYGPVRMIRERRWKYVHRYPFGPHELYDLEADPGEVNNRLEDPAVSRELERLRARLDEWFANYTDPGRDGARLPVTGKGQIDLCDSRGEGRQAFEPAGNSAR